MDSKKMFHRGSLTGRVSIVGTVLIITLGLLGVGFFYFFSLREESKTRTQTAQNLKLLNSHSHPEAGDEWIVSFETMGPADLTITPTDQDSIGDLDFISLTCDGKEKIEEEPLQILEGDVIFYPNWQCDGTGELTHLVNIARKHTLKFQFEDKMAFAYNNPDSVTDTFDNEDYIASKENITVSGGQVYLATCGDNGDACSVGGECCSGNCIDSYCCNTACGGNCDRCNVGGSLGTCTDVASDCTGNCDVCTSGNCAADNSLCNCDTCSGSGTEFNCSNDNVTTNWGAGTYGCGSVNGDQRCYNGACKDCSATGGYFYSDGCSCVSFRSAEGKVCWREGAEDVSCDTACSGYSGCIDEDWNDSSNCTVMRHFWPLLSTCSGLGGVPNSAPTIYFFAKGPSWIAQYRSVGNAQYCNLSDQTGEPDYRACVCEY